MRSVNEDSDLMMMRMKKVNRNRLLDDDVLDNRYHRVMKNLSLMEIVLAT